MTDTITYKAFLLHLCKKQIVYFKLDRNRTLLVIVDHHKKNKKINKTTTV